MPKMTHWKNSREPVNVPSEKAATYAAQGWVVVDQAPAKVQPAVVRDSTQEPAPAKPAKKSAAKKSTAKKK